MRMPGRGRGRARHRRGEREKRHQAKAANAVPEIGHALPPVVAVSVRQATKPSLYERRHPLLGRGGLLTSPWPARSRAFLSRTGKTASRRFPCMHAKLKTPEVLVAQDGNQSGEGVNRSAHRPIESQNPGTNKAGRGSRKSAAEAALFVSSRGSASSFGLRRLGERLGESFLSGESSPPGPFSFELATRLPRLRDRLLVELALVAREVRFELLHHQDVGAGEQTNSTLQVADLDSRDTDRREHQRHPMSVLRRLHDAQSLPKVLHRLFSGAETEERLTVVRQRERERPGIVDLARETIFRVLLDQFEQLVVHGLRLHLVPVGDHGGERVELLDDQLGIAELTRERQPLAEQPLSV